MKNEERLEALLEKPYAVVDILPKQVPADSPGQYFAVEDWYLQHIGALRQKYAHVLLKLNCYYDFCLVSETEERINPAPEILLDAVMHNTGTLNILTGPDISLITLNHNDTYMTVYDPSDELKDLLAKLALSEGLFLWTPAQ